tara:strand:+ start:426 stop:635 length:210 start_codon:yes stop_codon:yes gene_type:complete
LLIGDKMRNLIKIILTSILLLSVTPAPAMDMNMAGMEEIKKKKKKKNKKIGKKGKKSKKGFFSKVFGSK